MSFNSNGGDRPLAVGKSTTLNVYMPNGDNKVIKYVSGTNIRTICDLVVNKLGHGERPYSKSYALYLRHTDPSKVKSDLSYYYFPSWCHRKGNIMAVSVLTLVTSGCSYSHMLSL